MQNLLKRLWKEERGQDLVEYALLLVLVTLVAAASVQSIGATVAAVFTNATADLTT